MKSSDNMRVCLEVSKIYFISPNFAFFLASLFEPSFLVANIIIIIKIFKNKATEPAIIIIFFDPLRSLNWL